MLRIHKLGEADRIITLLTRQHGRIRAVARGIRRTTSKFGARLEPCGHVDVQLATGRSLDVITQAESRHAYGERIVDDYTRYTTAAAMLETAERLTIEEREPATQQFLLLLGALGALAGQQHAPELILDSFLLRSMAIAGYAPSFSDCARCGVDGPHRSFSPGAGGMVCQDCRPAGVATPAPDTVSLLGALLTGDWSVADVSERRHRREASGLVAAYTQWHLESGIRAITHLDRGGGRTGNPPSDAPVDADRHDPLDSPDQDDPVTTELV